MGIVSLCAGVAGLSASLPDITGAPMRREQINKRICELLNRRMPFVWGVADQAIVSGCSLFLTLVLANALDVQSFGRFSIAWAFLILLESVLFRGLFDDGLPAVAHRVASSRWPQLRASLYVASIGTSGLFGVAFVVAGLVALSFHFDHAALLIATGTAIPSTRLQSVFRRIGYLDGRLRRVVSGALIYAVVLAGSAAAMIWLQLTSAAAAMACVALSSAAAGLFGLVYAAGLAKPHRRVLTWLITRLLREGRWFAATSLTYWISSIGLIPLCGLLIGLEASASLRLMLVVFAPLSQLNASLLSVKLPGAALTLRHNDRAMFLSLTRSNAMLFGGLSALYGGAAALLGVPILAWLVSDRGFDVSEVNMALMALAMSLDGIWLGLALPLFAVGRPQQFLASRITGLAVLCLSLPVGTYAWGVAGVIGAMVLSSAASVGVLGTRLVRLETPKPIVVSSLYSDRIS